MYPMAQDLVSDSASEVLSMVRRGDDIDIRCFKVLFEGQMIGPVTGLHIAVAIESIELAEDLLELGADVNAFTGYRYNPFVGAEENIIPMGKNIVYSPLHMAVIKDNEDMCRLLIRYEADVNAYDHKRMRPIEYSLDNVRLFELLYDSGTDLRINHFEREPLIFRAIQRKNIDLIRFLGKESLINYVYENQSPVEFAMNWFHESVPLLISFGQLLSYANEESGEYPLHIAVRWGRYDWVKALCDKPGVNPNAMDFNRKRPLHIAVQDFHPREFVLTLVSSGANPNAKNRFGVNPIALAAQIGNEELLTLFLQKGMDPRLSRNMSEFERAVRFRKFNTASILLKEYQSIDESLKFDGESILWFFVKQCVGEKENDDKQMADALKQLVDKSSVSAVNSVDSIWGTLMHYLIYAEICCPAKCYKPLFNSLISCLKFDINQVFSPTETRLKTGEVIPMERIMANGSALSFALEMDQCHYYAEQLIRLGADYSTIKWDQIYFSPLKVKAFKLLVYVGSPFPDNFREWADPVLDGSLDEEDCDYYTHEFDKFMKWWDVRRSTPLSLKQKSRNVIRRAIGSSGCRRLVSEGSQLFGPFGPLPEKLIDFILFKTDEDFDF